MTSSSPYVPRPRLTDRLQAHQAWLLDAGGGAGKTSLALELADVCDLAPVHVTLDGPAASPREVIAQAAGALARLGYTRSAAVASGLQHLSSLAEAIAAIDHPALLIIDDVHHAGPEAVAGLTALTAAVPEPHRLALLTRRIPDGLTLDGARLTHDDLALTVDETTALARELLPADRDPSEVAAGVHTVTHGWVAPTLAALTAPGELHGTGTAWRSVQDIVERILGVLSADDRDRLTEVAALPRLNAQVVAVLEATGALRSARNAGVPVRRLGGGWFALANPFGEALAGSRPLDPARLERVARAFADAGEILLAADLLRRHADDRAVARLLAGVPLDEALPVHGSELLDVIVALGDEAVHAHPGALLTGSLVAFLLGRPGTRRSLVDRLLQAADGTPFEPLAAAEDLLVSVWSHPPDPEVLAGRARDLAATHGGDPAVNARLAEVQARALAMSDGHSFEQLDVAWAACADAWDRAGYRTQSARATIWQAVQAAWAGGDASRALRLIDDALTRAGGAPSLRLLGLLYRGMVLVDIGRYDEAEATLKRGRALAVALRADVRRGHIAWFTARMASQRGDPDATLAAVRRAEAADVTDAAGGVFFAADAATLLARVGLDAEADERLAYALEHDPGGSEKVPLAAMDLAARRGDLDTALTWHERMQEREATERRDRWRHRLLLAWAAHLTDDPRRDDWAVEAFDAAGALGEPDLPFVREPTIARALVGVAAAVGSATAALLLEQGFAHIRLLGGFEVSVPGAPTATPAGMQAQALKFLAVRGGRVQQEALIEALWPEVDPDRGRQRLRVVLSRLKSEVGDLLVRDGETLALAAGVTVDATAFDELAQRALIQDDLATAEAAVSAYHGPLLPDDPYEDWAAVERDRLAWRYLALLDRLASAAADTGDLERALSLLYIGLDEEPEDEDRYVMAARLLCEQSRHARARALLERATRVLEARDLTPSRRLLDLLDRLRV